MPVVSEELETTQVVDPIQRMDAPLVDSLAEWVGVSVTLVVMAVTVLFILGRLDRYCTRIATSIRLAWTCPKVSGSRARVCLFGRLAVDPELDTGAHWSDTHGHYSDTR